MLSEENRVKHTNTVGRMQSFNVLKQMVPLGFKGARTMETCCTSIAGSRVILHMILILK
jgi:hypothetical protein